MSNFSFSIKGLSRSSLSISFSNYLFILCFPLLIFAVALTSLIIGFLWIVLSLRISLSTVLLDLSSSESVKPAISGGSVKFVDSILGPLFLLCSLSLCYLSKWGSSSYFSSSLNFSCLFRSNLICSFTLSSS